MSKKERKQRECLVNLIEIGMERIFTSPKQIIPIPGNKEQLQDNFSFKLGKKQISIY